MTGHSLQLRAATAEDARCLFDWANDPTTRRMSFSRAPIEWREHVSWLETRLRDPDSLLWIVLAGEVPVGQLRLDITGEQEATLSFAVAPERRGKRLGREILRLATGAARASGRIATIVAWVRPENEASLRTLSRAGYGPAEPTCYRDLPARFLRLALEP